MSLINDALKRAKQAQQQSQPSASSGPQLRPVEPAQAARRGAGLLLPFGLALVALFALFWLWQLSQRNVLARSTESKPVAAALQKPASSIETAPAPALSATSFVLATGTVANTAPPPAPQLASAAAVPANVASNSPVTSSSVAGQTAQTNPAALPAEALPPKPAPLKLQAIVFHPTRPSAMISGRPLFVGDHVGEFQVQAIGQESVTLVSGEKTNILSLFQ